MGYADCRLGLVYFLNARALANLSRRAETYPIPEEGERFYLCRNGACLEPVDSAAALREQLRERREPVLQ